MTSLSIVLHLRERVAQLEQRVFNAEQVARAAQDRVLELENQFEKFRSVRTLATTIVVVC